MPGVGLPGARRRPAGSKRPARPAGWRPPERGARFYPATATAIVVGLVAHAVFRRADITA